MSDSHEPGSHDHQADQLLDDWFDDQLSSKDTDRLRQLLMTDPEARQRFLRRGHREAILQQVFAQSRRRGDTKRLRTTHAHRRPQGRTLVGRFGVGLLVAAAVVWAIFLQQGPQAASLDAPVQLQVLEGTVMLQRNGDRQVARAGMALQVDDLLEVEGQARATVRYLDGTEIRLDQAIPLATGRRSDEGSASV